MSESIHYFGDANRRFAVALPFVLDDCIEHWQQIQRKMISGCPNEFTRDEWAYLIRFLDSNNLQQPFVQSFGVRIAGPLPHINVLVRRRGPVAVWLPNNVSILGPLTVVLLSLTGSPLRLKSGSRARDLTSAWIGYIREQLLPGSLKDYFQSQVVIDSFDRDDLRNKCMAAEAAVRIVFGSDEAAAFIEALPHPTNSHGFAFSDRQSEAWLYLNSCNKDLLATLIKVFAIYGQAGCTSPRRVVLIDSNYEDALHLRGQLADVWSQVIPAGVQMHIATENILARQLAAALSWDASLVEGNRAVLAVGTARLKQVDSLMVLHLIPATVQEAIATLPRNIQTIGYATELPHTDEIVSRLAATRVMRFVPLAQMHHFGSLWDGWNFWRQTFEEVEIA